MREKLSKDNMELLTNFIDKRIKESYIKYYNGKVINNEDPEKLGRCRIRVFGVYGNDIPDEDIPWALPDFAFIGSTLGSFVVPPVDAIVKVYFDDKNTYAPKYTTKVLDTNNMPTDIDDDYPNTMIFFETDEGDFFKINRKTLETTYHTASGVTILIDPKGNVEMSLEGADIGHGDVNILDGHGNTMSMDSEGVKVNGHFLATDTYVAWLAKNLAALSLGNLGAPSPISPVAAAEFTTNNALFDKYLTDKAPTI